jgi:hypothetical protein
MARPSTPGSTRRQARRRRPASGIGTENTSKSYAESFQDQAHLDVIVSGAQDIVSHAQKATDPGPRKQEDDHE